MSHSRSAPLPVPPGSEGDLARLIATEHQLTLRLEAARAECAARLAAARDQVAVADGGLEAELARAVALVEREVTERTRERIAALEQSARTRTARYAAVSDAEAASLARAVREWLAAPRGSPA